MRIAHIIDHEGEGTIHYLVRPLSVFEGVSVFSLTDIITHQIDFSLFADYSHIIVHTSGGGGGIILTHLRDFFPNRHRIFVFFHTSFEYQKYKGRGNKLIANLREQGKEIVVFTPSTQVSEQYKELGFPVFTIQIGIPPIKKEATQDISSLSVYYGKIITTCTSSKSCYKYIKGLDLFQLCINELKAQQNALICGIDNYTDNQISCFKFNCEDFLNVLAHSKIYVQFSRFESYNTTAIQAKQLGIPVVVLNTEGTQSCMGNYVFNSVFDAKQEIRRIITSSSDHNLLARLKQDSLKRESINSFHNSINYSIHLIDEQFTQKSI